MLGSIDSNTGSPDLGWDTDQFPMDIKNTALIMKVHMYTSYTQTLWTLSWLGYHRTKWIGPRGTEL